MNNKLIDKYLFCEKRIKKIEIMKSDNKMFNYNFKAPINFFIEKLMYLLYVSINASIGFYSFNTIVVNKYANNILVSFLLFLLIFLIAAIVNYIIFYLFKFVKLKNPKRILKEKNELKKEQIEKIQKKNKKDNFEVILLSFVPLLGIIFVFSILVEIWFSVKQYFYFRKNKKRYAKKTYLKQYSPLLKLMNKKSMYKKKIMEDEQTVKFLYDNKNNSKYINLYNEILESFRKEENESVLINKRFKKNVISKNIKINNY